MKYVITAVAAVLGVTIAVRVIKQVKPDWGAKLATFIVGA